MDGRRSKLAEVYRRHGASVYRRALRILGNEAEAKEVLQDLFLSLLERPSELTTRSTWSSYLYAACTHACLNRLRNVRNRARLMEQVPPDDPAAEMESLVTLRHALERLPAQLAEVAIYYHLDGLSHQEIADLLGCSRRHVGHLLERTQAWARSQEEPCPAG